MAQEAVLTDSARTPRVFVVDDEQVIATTISLILDKAGYESRAFFDPTAMLAAIDDAMPDLVISDIVMPQMTGIDVAIQLRNTHPELKLILFSGQAATSVLLEAAKKKGHDFEVLAKPVHPTVLLGHVAGLLKGSQASPQLTKGYRDISGAVA